MSRHRTEVIISFYWLKLEPLHNCLTILLVIFGVTFWGWFFCGNFLDKFFVDLFTNYFEQFLRNCQAILFDDCSDILWQLSGFFWKLFKVILTKWTLGSKQIISFILDTWNIFRTRFLKKRSLYIRARF